MHVAVLGAGYAGITLARRLESTLPADVRLTVVDERDTHLVQHLVHRAIRDPALAEDLQIPLSELLTDAEHRRARVESVDTTTGRVELDDGDALSYDVGAVCLGARTNFHDLAGVREHGRPLKRVRHALAIRERFLERCADPEPAADEPGRVVVGGAGTSGVQVAGELAELAADRDAAVEIRLLEQRETVVPSFPPGFQNAVRDALAARDVHVSTGAAIESADEAAVRLADGTAVDYDLFVWAGGITGGSAMDDSRPQVRATLRLDDRTFALGDAVQVVDADGMVAPATAQAAMNQAPVAATNVARLVDHDRSGDRGFEPRLRRYRHDPLGWLVSVGDDAVAQVGPTVLTGATASAIKSSVGLGYLGSMGRLSGAVEFVRDHLQ
jgi:NADH dehydrogenase